jgi:WD40 repeat protein
MYRNNVTIPLAIGGLSFALAGILALMMGQERKLEAQAGSATAPALATPAAAESKPAEVEARPNLADAGSKAEARNEGEKDRVEPPPPEKPLLIKHWKMPGEPKKDGDRWGDIRVNNLYLDPTGTRLVTQTRLETICWDVPRSKGILTYRPETKITQRSAAERDVRIMQEILVSPDARVVAIVNKDGTEVLLRVAETGEVIADYKPMKGGGLWTDDNHPAFTPGSDYLLFATCLKNVAGDRYVFAAISTRDGKARILDLPSFEKRHYMYTAMAPVPRASGIFFDHSFDFIPGTSSHVTFVDLKTGKEAPVATDFPPISSFPETGIRVSPDGRYLLVTSGQFAVYDWRALKTYVKLPGLSPAWFTPDGRRIVAHGAPARMMLLPSGQQYTEPADLRLYDIATGQNLGMIKIGALGFGSITSISFSGDGKTFAIADYIGKVAVVDFEQAFQVAPLPPMCIEGPEQLPLR